MPQTTKKCVYLSKEEIDVISMAMYRYGDDVHCWGCSENTRAGRKYKDCVLRFDEHGRMTKELACDECESCIEYNRQRRISEALSTKLNAPKKAKKVA